MRPATISTFLLIIIFAALWALAMLSVPRTIYFPLPGVAIPPLSLAAGWLSARLYFKAHPNKPITVLNVFMGVPWPFWAALGFLMVAGASSQGVNPLQLIWSLVFAGSLFIGAPMLLWWLWKDFLTIARLFSLR